MKTGLCLYLSLDRICDTAICPICPIFNLRHCKTRQYMKWRPSEDCERLEGERASNQFPLTLESRTLSLGIFSSRNFLKSFFFISPLSVSVLISLDMNKLTGHWIFYKFSSVFCFVSEGINFELCIHMSAFCIGRSFSSRSQLKH